MASSVLRAAGLAGAPPRALAAVGAARAASSAPPTPDYNTPVNVADMKLAPRTKAAWRPPAPRAGSLVQQTLREMATDDEFQLSAKKLREVRCPLA
jgi:hypothetical protein